MKKKRGKHNGRLLHFIIFNDIPIEDKRRYEQEKRERKKEKNLRRFSRIKEAIKISQKKRKVRWVYERQKKDNSELFKWDGKPSADQVFPCGAAVLAAVVGCVTPAKFWLQCAE